MNFINLFHYLLVLFLLYPLCVFAQDRISSITVKDDQGYVITLKSPAKRIISLAPDITETLFALDAGHLIIATVDSCDYPQAAKNIPHIGSYRGLDLEKIVALHPDLIINFSHSFSRQLSLLKKLGIPVYRTDPHRIQDIAITLRNLGRLIDQEEKGNQEADLFLSKLASIQKQFYIHQEGNTTHFSKPSLSVFYQIGTYSLITINKNSWINQAITLCGGKNVFAELKTAAPQIDPEALVKANPEVILSDAKVSFQKRKWWSELSAVKNDQLYTINPDVIDRASPRLLEGILQICKSLQLARARIPSKKVFSRMNEGRPTLDGMGTSNSN